MTPEVAAGAMSTAETVLFWVVAPLAVASASALVWAKRAVVAAVCVVVTMVCLAILYVALDAPFLGVAQVVVYTGAVMMLFVFVIMLVGVDVADSFTELIRGQRAASAVFAVGLLVVLVGAVVRATLPDPAGTPEAGDGGNPGEVAALVFSDYPFTLELVGTLLIVAAVGAVVLTHRSRLGPKRTQRELSIERVRAGAQVPPLPAPGVYAGRNAADVPAIDADGLAIPSSVPESLRVRGQARRVIGFAQAPFELGPAPEPAPEPDPEPEGGDGE
jgi:NADH-quinone oxidoreductase subunit J